MEGNEKLLDLWQDAEKICPNSGSVGSELIGI